MESSKSKKSVEKDVSEIENDKDMDSQGSEKHTEIDSPKLDKKGKMDIPVLEERKDMKTPELEGDASDLEKRITRNTSELKKRMKRNSYELKNGRGTSDVEKKSNDSELEKMTEGSALDKETLRVDEELEKRTEDSASDLQKRTADGASELENRLESSALEKKAFRVGVELEKSAGVSDLEKRNESFASNSHIRSDIPDETIERVDETDVPLLVGDAVSIEMKGGPEGTPTVHVHAKKEAAAKKKEIMYPIQRMKNAWDTSSNVFSFFLRAILIIFTTLGWMMCVGGIPFVSIAMIAIGSLYFDDCRVQPKIPLCLVVSGVCGTVQHFIAFWNKYLPEESQGRLKVYRRYYSFIDGAMTLFLLIWFILGCVWVYGVKEVDFQDDYKDEYCHKTLYYFAFWLLNISFIIIAVVMVLGLCAILCIVALPKEEAVV